MEERPQCLTPSSQGCQPEMNPSDSELLDGNHELYNSRDCYEYEKLSAQSDNDDCKQSKSDVNYSIAQRQFSETNNEHGEPSLARASNASPINNMQLPSNDNDIQARIDENSAIQMNGIDDPSEYKELTADCQHSKSENCKICKAEKRREQTRIRVRLYRLRKRQEASQ